MNSRILTKAIALALPVALSIQLQADVTKAPTGTNLVDPASWGGVLPTPADTAIWESTSLGAGLTLNDPAAVAGITVNGALSDIDLSGIGTLSLGTGGIDTVGSGIGVSIANPILADGVQTWATDSTFSFSGDISGTDALTFVGESQTTATYGSYLTPTAVVTFPNATLADFTNAEGHMNGNSVGGAGFPGTAFKFVNDGTTATFQLRWLEDPYTKGVKVELIQDGLNITGRAVYAKYIQNGLDIDGTDFDNAGNTNSIATGPGVGGYGVETLTVIGGSNSTTSLAGASTHSGGMIFDGGLVTGGTGVNYNSSQGGSFGTGDVTINAGATVTTTSARVLGGGDITTRTVNINGGTANIEGSGTGGEYIHTLNLTGGTVTADTATTYFRTPNGGGAINSLSSDDASRISSGLDMTYASLAVETADGAADNDLIISGIISEITAAGTGAKSITKTGAGSLLLSGANTFTGGIAVTEGTLKLGHLSGFGAYLAGQPVDQITVAPGAMVDFNGSRDAIYGYTIIGDGIGGAGALTNNGAAIFNGARQASNILLAGDASIGGTGNWSLLTSGYNPTSLDLAGNTLTKVGPNTIALASTTVTAGAINVDEGTFALGVINPGGGSGAVAPDTAVTLADASGVELSVVRNSSIGSLAGGGLTGGDVVLAGGTLTNGALGTDTTFDGILGGTGAIVKTGAGTLTLTEAPLYTGSLTVEEGTVEIAGQIVGTVSVSSEGALSPGGAAIDILSADEVSLLGTTLCQIDKTGATLTGDLIDSAGNVTYGGILQVTATGDALVLGDTFQLFNALGSYDGGFANFNLPPTPAGLSWDVSNLTVDGTIAISDVVMEPSLSLPGGGYAGSPEITLSAEDGATIYYTLDGTPPTASSTEYTGPITLPANTTDYVLKTIATKPGQTDSPVVTATYNTIDTPTWNVDNNGDWSVTSNWLNSVVPNGPGVIADFNSFPQSAGSFVTLDADHSVGNMIFGNPDPFDWEVGAIGGSVLTLDGGGTTPTIEVASQNATISAPLAGTAGFAKTGPGTLTLSGPSTYSGETTVATGQLTGASNAAFGTSAITIGTAADPTALYLAQRADVGNDVTVSAAGTGPVVIGADNTGAGANAASLSGTLTLNRPVTLSGEVVADRLAIDGKITGNVGTLTVSGGARTTFRSVDNDFVGDLVVTGADTVLQASVGSAPEVIPDTTNVTVETDAILQFASNGTRIETINSLNGDGIVRTYPTGNFPANLAVGAADGGGTFSGVMENGTGALSFTKIGTGTQILSGANTYTGPTAVNDGTLAVTGSLEGNTTVTVTSPGVFELGDGSVTEDCWMSFLPTANNTSNSITGDGTATLNDAIMIDLGVADLTSGNTWLLVDVTTLTESYGSNFEVTGFTESSTGVWTAANFGADWTFTEATGILSVEIAGYGVWAAANAPGQTMDQDHDNDGTQNGVEYFMGESGSGFTAMPALDATNTVSYPRGGAYAGTYGTDYLIQTSSTLQVWDDVLSSDPNLNDGDPLEYTLPTGSGTLFVRLKVTGP